MKYYMLVILILGAVETLVNTFFLTKIVGSGSYKEAKKFHGDFPPYESNKKLLIKVIAMLIIGLIGLGAYVFYKLDYNYMKMLYAFIGSLLVVCGFQAVVYGGKHKPAIGSLVPGIVLAVVLYFLN